MSVSETTRDLVSIPSDEDETAAGDYIETWLREHTDGAIERDAVGNVIARKGGDEGAETASLALVGHHDVVPPAEEQVASDEEFVVYEEDGRLYGRGTADMKGAVAACMHAFRDADPAGELIFASFVGEETGGEGATHAVESGFDPDYAIVAEGSTNYSGPDVTDVVYAHRGRRGSTITARGAAAHASEPEAGQNAIYRASDAVDVIRELEPPETTVRDMPFAGSVVATKIHGGDTANVIPDVCEITIDERTVPGGYADLGRVEEVEGVEWTIDSDTPPMQCSDDAFAETVLDAATDAQDAQPELTTKPHATDAGRLAQAGIACVVCGASEPGEAHTDNESVGIDVLERCYRIYKGTAERL